MEGRILEYLKENKFITSYEAFILFGETRLSARIFDLKRKGYKFTDEWIHKENRYGDKVKFKKYILKEDEK